MSDSQKFFPQKGAPENAVPARPTGAVESTPAMFEARVANRLGISRDEIRLLRQTYLTEGTHWALLGRRVYLTPEAVTVLSEKKGLPVPSLPVASPPRSVPARQMLLLQAPFKGELVCWSVCRNEHIVMAHYPGADPKNTLSLVRVIVKSNKNFVRGMRLQAEHCRDDLYELVGNLSAVERKILNEDPHR